MSRNDVTTARPLGCPYLGLADDPRMRFDVPAEQHRCHAGSDPKTIDESFQGDYCLSGQYPMCDRYHPLEEIGAVGGDPAVGEEPAVAVAASADAVAAVASADAAASADAVAAVPMTPKPSRDLVGVFPARDPATDSPPVPMEILGTPLFAPVPPAPHGPSTPPPTAWRAETTSSVLKSVLPPLMPLHAATASDVPSATATTTTMTAALLAAAHGVAEAKPAAGSDGAASPLMLAGPVAAAEPVADIRARIPRTAPLAARPAVAVAVGPWPDASHDATPVGITAQPSVRRRRLRRGALLLLALFAVVVVAAAVAATASGALDRWLPAGLHAGTITRTSAADVPTLRGAPASVASGRANAATAITAGSARLAVTLAPVPAPARLS